MFLIYHVYSTATHSQVDGTAALNYKTFQLHHNVFFFLNNDEVKRQPEQIFKP